MIDVDNIVNVPGWTIEKVASDSKKVQITLTLSKEIIGERASNVARGLIYLQGEGCPTMVGVYSPCETDSDQAVLPQIVEDADDEDAEDEDDEDDEEPQSDLSEEPFIELE